MTINSDHQYQKGPKRSAEKKDMTKMIRILCSYYEFLDGKKIKSTNGCYIPRIIITHVFSSLDVAVFGRVIGNIQTQAQTRWLTSYCFRGLYYVTHYALKFIVMSNMKANWIQKCSPLLVFLQMFSHEPTTLLQPFLSLNPLDL